jgi:hypothetical protein
MELGPLWPVPTLEEVMGMMVVPHPQATERKWNPTRSTTIPPSDE